MVSLVLRKSYQAIIIQSGTLFILQHLLMLVPQFFPSHFVALPPAIFDASLNTQLQHMQQRYQILEAENKYLKNLLEKKKQSNKISRKKERRTAQNLDKSFKCPYSGCRKEYASDLAVNLHIKNKHNGGTKTLREALARDIVLAEEKGEEIPNARINFPPGYMKEFRKRYFKEE